MVRSREATGYKTEVGWLCLQAQLKPVHGDISMSMDLYRPAKRGDLDNYIKILIDSLIGWVYFDDSQIVEIHAMRHDDKADPRVEISITEVEQ